MNGINKILFVGRLTKDPELKVTDNGRNFCNITLAIDKPYKDKEGNRNTIFLPFTLWGKQAENICNISKKGALISLEGSMNMRTIYENGEERQIYNPNISSYHHLANKKDYSNNIESKKSEGITM